MKFRKKPVIINAEQYTGHGPDPVGVFRRPEDATPYVVTIHDQHYYLTAGDWVVPEPDGVHFYPIKPEVMVQNYELVADNEHTHTVVDAGLPTEFGGEESA
jgi:hypothetical protein